MGYFKKRRELRDAKALKVIEGLVTSQAETTIKMVRAGVLDAINLFDQKKYEYESNVRENLEQLIHHEGAGKLTEEIAQVIDDKAKVYGYRIAKGKRTELAQDILVALSVKK